MSFISTGSRWLDEALGGGLKRGGMTAVTGGEGFGKTGLALRAVAAARRAGLEVALVDTDGAAQRAPAGIWLGRPASGEQALEMAGRLAGSGGVDLVVLDVLGSADGRSLGLLAGSASTGGCALVVVGPAWPFGCVPTALSLRITARLDLQLGGRLRVLSPGRPARWGVASA